MSLNRYGFLYQQYLKEKKPALYEGLEKSNQLNKVLHKKQEEILKYRNELYEQIEKNNIFDKNDYKNEENYEYAIKEYIENKLNDKLDDFFAKDDKVITIIEKNENK